MENKNPMTTVRFDRRTKLALMAALLAERDASASVEAAEAVNLALIIEAKVEIVCKDAIKAR